MHYNHYGRDPVLLGADLANQHPRTPQELGSRASDAGLVLDAAPSRTDLALVLEFLDRWRRVAELREHGKRAEALNALLAEFAAAPRLTDHAGTGWHLHFRDGDLPIGRQIAALVTVGTALHLTGLGMDRLGVCDAEDCPRIYADVSRNGRQRFCSPACATRMAVRRHRARSAVRVP